MSKEEKLQQKAKQFSDNWRLTSSPVEDGYLAGYKEALKLVGVNDKWWIIVCFIIGSMGSGYVWSEVKSKHSDLLKVAKPMVDSVKVRYQTKLDGICDSLNDYYQNN